MLECKIVVCVNGHFILPLIYAAHSSTTQYNVYNIRKSKGVRYYTLAHRLDPDQSAAQLLFTET